MNFRLSQSQKPGPYVKEMNDAATFYTNRVLKDYKDTYVQCRYYPVFVVLAYILSKQTVILCCQTVILHVLENHK